MLIRTRLLFLISMLSASPLFATEYSCTVLAGVEVGEEYTFERLGDFLVDSNDGSYAINDNYAFNCWIPGAREVEFSCALVTPSTSSDEQSFLGMAMTTQGSNLSLVIPVTDDSLPSTYKSLAVKCEPKNSGR